MILVGSHTWPGHGPWANLWCSATLLNAGVSGLHNAPVVSAWIVVLRPDDLQVEVNGVAAWRAMVAWPGTSPNLEMVCLLKMRISHGHVSLPEGHMISERLKKVEIFETTVDWQTSKMLRRPTNNNPPPQTSMLNMTWSDTLIFVEGSISFVHRRQPRSQMQNLNLEGLGTKFCNHDRVWSLLCIQGRRFPILWHLRNAFSASTLPAGGGGLLQVCSLPTGQQQWKPDGTRLQWVR